MPTIYYCKFLPAAILKSPLLHVMSGFGFPIALQGSLNTRSSSTAVKVFGPLVTMYGGAVEKTFFF